MADFPAGMAGAATVVLGPKDLAAGTATIAYAIGSDDAKTLTLAAQTIKNLAPPPRPCRPARVAWPPTTTPPAGPS
ncbi:hypothetical protein MUY14_21575 [Amycolatopsis sp. FBCC-B4732]|uniref:hypothetical protein n=1 Tax=Amycolatopsis sp. FBCC-B4732 TaxID=3079339 RepID=UPI001FF35836|nr:hypothetical protein [Amycolatopsis sp. FBCC-B4732]UOX93079.1 hypothetical protein MUY14_21575 [Amycolatopsis sp. FBCC-B4732]